MSAAPSLPAAVTVPSRSEPGVTHRVWRERGGWRCSCWGYFYRGRCHHLAQAPALWIEEEPMSTTTTPVELGAVETALAVGDLAQLNSEDRTRYLLKVCQSLGLNPYSRPFQYIMLNNRLVLYATRDAADQLRKLHGVSIRIVGRERVDDLYIVTAEATDQHGRVDTSLGVVSLRGLGGEALANALMKTETKAKRRVTLSICGLGWLDETEIETIPHVTTVEQPAIPALGAGSPVENRTRPAPETRRDVPKAPAAPNPMHEWWLSVRAAGWSSDDIQNAAQGRYSKAVQNLDQHQLAELRDAAVSGRLQATAEGQWVVVDVGEEEGIDKSGF